jgi:hypothetical protein
MLLQAFYSIRSERQLMERLDFDLLFRWFMGHALMENRNGLVVDACLTEANGHAERIAALHIGLVEGFGPRSIDA